MIVVVGGGGLGRDVRTKVFEVEKEGLGVGEGGRRGQAKANSWMVFGELLIRVCAYLGGQSAVPRGFHSFPRLSSGCVCG